MHLQWKPSIPNTLGPERTVLNIEVSLFQRLKMYYRWQSLGNHLVPVAYVPIRGVTAIQGAGLDGLHCIM